MPRSYETTLPGSSGFLLTVPNLAQSDPAKMWH